MANVFHPVLGSFSNTWFSGSEMKQVLHRFLDGSRELSLLEIGVFEGASTCWLLEEMCKHPGSTLTAVDPFSFCGTDPSDAHHSVAECTTSLRRFFHNASGCQQLGKLRFLQQRSDEFFRENRATFDFCYIDGSHVLSDVLDDLRAARACMKPGGLIWMDDYLYEWRQDYAEKIDEAVRELCLNSETLVEVVHKGYQLGLRCC